MNKKLNLLYFSATDATAKIVKAVAGGFNNNANEYDITFPENRLKDLNFDSNDIVIIGIPVYAGRVPEFLSDYFTNVHGNNSIAVYIVVYGNRAYDDALLELKDIFERNGFISMAGGAFIGEHSYTFQLATGRPDTNDLNIAYKFGLEINEKLRAYQEQPMDELFVKENYPYRERGDSQPVLIETNDNCINCGICAGHCPMRAINYRNYKEMDMYKCIKCCSCIKRCPVNAKEIKYELHRKFAKELVNKFGATRHEPELFI